jgi:Ala-tRNA(Pro) deacylase
LSSFMPLLMIQRKQIKFQEKSGRVMDKEEIYAYLTEKKIAYEITEHKAVFNMGELDSIDLPYPEWDAKNLFVRDDKKRNYYLITVRGDKRVDLKSFRKQHGLRPLSFASAEDLYRIMCLTPGSVSPFGLLNDKEHEVQFFLDADFAGNKIGVHPNDNAATVWLQAEELMKLILENGNKGEFTEID